MTEPDDRAPAARSGGWVPVDPALIRGALELEVTPGGLLPHRLPARARSLADGQLAMVESQTAGVRLCFTTTSTSIELSVRPTKIGYAGLPPRPDGLYDLVVDGRLTAQAIADGGTRLVIDLATGSADLQPGEPVVVGFGGLPAGAKDVVLWLPWNETTELLGLRTDAAVTPSGHRGALQWMHHGSSISHGSNAASPSTTWPAVAARQAGIELVNLGFGGSALLDPFVAQVIRDTPADLISLKLGINVVNADAMRLRAFVPAVHGFLDVIRQGHPTTPLLVVSPLLAPIHETNPGPTAPDLSSIATGQMRFMATPGAAGPGKLTLQLIRSELARIVELRRAQDPHLYYLDGRELYGDADSADHPLPDALHPDAATHLLIGKRFARLAPSPWTAGR